MRKFFLALVIGCVSMHNLFAGSADSSSCKWRPSIAMGQYTATIGLPNTTPLRLGVQLGANRQWNKNQKHQLRQSIYLATFKHNNLQTAVQLFSEVHYAFVAKNFEFSPLMLGGGYVASILDMPSVKFNGTKYEQVNNGVRNNFLISLGTQLMYQTPLKIADKKVSVFTNYRLQVQGIFIKENVPFVAYSSVNFGICLPWPFKK
jgi:hypothetical protein